MSADELPTLRGVGQRDPARCRKCGRTDFQTSLGVGKLYWWQGMGGVVRLDSPAGARIDMPVTCTFSHCRTEHRALIEFPPPESKILGRL